MWLYLYKCTTSVCSTWLYFCPTYKILDLLLLLRAGEEHQQRGIQAVLIRTNWLRQFAAAAAAAGHCHPKQAAVVSLLKPLS